MPITILDYVKSVVGDKDLYTAEDCLASGVDILGGCQGCHATIAVYNAYPSTSGYWRCADCIGDDGYATVADFTAPAPVHLPGLRHHRQPQRDPHHHRRAHRGIRAGMRGLRRGLAAMTTAGRPAMALRGIRPALRRYQRHARARSLDEHWHGPSAVRPMIQLRSLLDGGKAMTIAQADYDDPDRWWL